MDFLSYFKSLGLSKEFTNNIEDDFSDGVLVAQAIQKSIPNIVNIKEFDHNAQSPTRKHLNWVKLNGTPQYPIEHCCSKGVSSFGFPTQQTRHRRDYKV